MPQVRLWWLIALSGCSAAPSPERPAQPRQPGPAASAPPPCGGQPDPAPLLSQGRLRRAAELLERGAAACPAEARWAELLRVEAELGRHERVIELSAALSGRGLLPEAALGEARARAAAALRPSTEAERASMRALYGKGQEAFAAGRYGQARQLFEEAWRAFRPNGQALERAGVAARLEGDEAASRRLFDRAVVELERAHPGERLRVDVPNGFDGPPHAAFSPDNRVLLVAHGGWLSELSAASLRERARLDAGDRAASALAVSPDGRWLAVGASDGMIRAFQGPSWQPRAPLGGHRGAVSALLFDEAGSLASGAFDRRVRRWEIEGNAPAGDDELDGVPRALFWGAKGALLAAVSGRLVRVGAADQKSSPLADALARASAEGAVSAVCAAPGGKALAVGRPGGSVELWDIPARKRRASMAGHEGSVVSLAFAPDGKMLASGGEDRSLRLWDAAGGTALASLSRHSAGARGVAVGGAGVAVALEGEGVGVLGGAERWSGDRSRGGAVAVAAGKGLLFASFEGGRVVGFKEGGRGEVSIGPFAEAPRALAAAPEGLLVAGPGREASLWDGARGKELLRLRGHEGDVVSAAISSKLGFLATGSSDRTIRVWDAGNGALRGVLRGHAGEVAAVAFSPDGKLLASGSHDGLLRLWRVAPLVNWDEQSEVRSTAMAGHGQAVTAVAFSPDGQSVLSGGYDGTVRLWSSSFAAERWAVQVGSWVRGVAFLPEGAGWVAAADDGSVIFGATSDGGRSATARWVKNKGPYVLSSGGKIDLLGDTESLRALPTCRIGRLSFSFDLCEDQARSSVELLTQKLP